MSSGRGFTSAHIYMHARALHVLNAIMSNSHFTQYAYMHYSLVSVDTSRLVANCKRKRNTQKV